MIHPFKGSTLQGGYVALATVLVIAVVVTSIGLAVSTQSVDTVQSSLFAEKTHAARNFVEGCIEDVLLRLNENDAIPGTITLPEGSCSVTINSQVGSIWNFTVVGSQDGQTVSILVEAERSGTVSITDWLQQ